MSPRLILGPVNSIPYANRSIGGFPGAVLEEFGCGLDDSDFAATEAAIH